jgi:anthranilate phosphoribosyltransferase
MGIGNYIKEIGRGKDGARALTREQSADLFAQVLDGTVTDLEVGAFCLAMRIKGETAQELAGFLDATHARLQPVATGGHGTVVLPSYNGARKLPVLTPLLALLLARQGLCVLMHAQATETGRVSAQDVLLALGIAIPTRLHELSPGALTLVPTRLLCPALARLLDVRQVIGLRNPAHSVVKLMNPCDGPSVLVSSYTHPEYAISMGATFSLMRSSALLLRGTEGEAVADPRRTPAMDAFIEGQASRVQEQQNGALESVPDLPAPNASSTAAWIQAVLEGQKPVPEPIARQVAHIVHLSDQIVTRA